MRGIDNVERFHAPVQGRSGRIVAVDEWWCLVLGANSEKRDFSFEDTGRHYSSDFDLIVSVELGAQPYCRVILAPRSVRATAALSAADA